MRVRGRGSIGPELCTECFKRFRIQGLLKFGISLKVLPLKEKLVIVNCVLLYGHTNA